MAATVVEVAASAQIPSLAWELLYTVGTVKKKKKEFGSSHHGSAVNESD